MIFILSAILGLFLTVVAEFALNSIAERYNRRNEVPTFEFEETCKTKTSK